MWGSKQTSSLGTVVTNPPTYFPLEITLRPGELAHCQVQVVFSAAVSVPAVFMQTQVHSTLDDDPGEAWDDSKSKQLTQVAFGQGETADGSSPGTVRCSFTVADCYRFRVSLRGVNNNVQDGAARVLSATLSLRVDQKDL